MTALSGVGVAFSVEVVCALLFELNTAAEASTTSAVSKPFPRPIAVSTSASAKDAVPIISP